MNSPASPRADVFVSVVAPLRDDSSIVEAFLTELLAVLRRHYASYEVVLVDDGSRDGTPDAVRRLLRRYECVRLVELSRNCGDEVAITAGLDAAIGDFVAVMMPNSDPPDMVPVMVERARAGAEVVFGIRRARRGDSLLTRLLAHAFYWYNRRFLRLPIPVNSSQFRVFSRQAVNALVQIRDRSRHLRLLSGSIGFGHVGIPYDELDRNPARPRRSVASLIAVTLDMMVASSAHPLRVVTLLGIGGAMLNVVYAMYVVVIYLVKRNVAEGWTTLSLQVAGMFLLLFLLLTVLSEYVGHILAATSSRPLYYVRGEENSPIAIADEERRNVVTESHG